jgi:hypothetical protein
MIVASSFAGEIITCQLTVHQIRSPSIAGCTLKTSSDGFSEVYKIEKDGSVYTGVLATETHSSHTLNRCPKNVLEGISAYLPNLQKEQEKTFQSLKRAARSELFIALRKNEPDHGTINLMNKKIELSKISADGNGWYDAQILEGKNVFPNNSGAKIMFEGGARVSIFNLDTGAIDFRGTCERTSTMLPSTPSTSKLDKAKSTCTEIGFIAGTEKHGECVLKMMDN